jgi:hypothetical protein
MLKSTPKTTQTFQLNNKNLTVEEKIRLEKGRRHQVYSALDYLISRITYFDFFSKDAFEIASTAKSFAQICEKQNVTSEYLLLSFFAEKNELTKILKDFKITKTRIGKYISKNTNLKSRENSSWLSIVSKAQKFFGTTKKLEFKNLDYSYETNRLFEKAAENALTRFKTPVINSSILFITMLEEKELMASKMIRHIVKNDTDLFLLRYRILKELHNQEYVIRDQIMPHQHYFAYLLKTQLTEKQFSMLIKRETLEDSVAIFRDDLITQVLDIDIFKMLEEEVSYSMKLMNSRKYSV